MALHQKLETGPSRGAGGSSREERGGNAWRQVSEQEKPRDVVGAADADADMGDGDGESDVEAQEEVRTVDFDPTREHHYVIVVHGTFDAPPADGTKTWYQRPNPGEQNFCSKLGRLLDRGPVKGSSVWRELPITAEEHEGIPYPFHWDGSNTHQGRVDAATKLHRLIDMIAEKDPAARVHLVAHSHGGNVILKTVEMYMKLLSKKRKENWNPKVWRRFQAANKQAYEMIRKWRKIRLEQQSSWWRIFPFLVVWRNNEGEVSKAMGNYPWGYYKWWDTVLCLGALRQRMMRRQRVCTSPITNALGALVFLGTPFYVKRWEDWGFLMLAVMTLVSVGVSFVVIAFYIWCWRAIVLASTAKNPQLFQSDVVTPILVGVIAAFVLISYIVQTSRSMVFYSGNLYHHPPHAWSPAMSALAIHAGKLDEASLALSTEPIVRAYVFPHLTRLLKRNPWQPLPQRPSMYDRRRDWSAFFFNYTMALFWDVIFFIPSVLLALVSWIAAPFVTGAIQNLVVTVSFGLAPSELNFAYVYVDEYLELHNVTQSVEHWNVQKLLAQAKTRSLQGELLPGYEDDTIDAPEWLEPVDELAFSRAVTIRNRDTGTEASAAAAVAAADARGHKTDDLLHPSQGIVVGDPVGHPAKGSVSVGGYSELALQPSTSTSANESSDANTNEMRGPVLTRPVSFRRRTTMRKRNFRSNSISVPEMGLPSSLSVSSSTGMGGGDGSAGLSPRTWAPPAKSAFGREAADDDATARPVTAGTDGGKEGGVVGKRLLLRRPSDLTISEGPEGSDGREGDQQQHQRLVSGLADVSASLPAEVEEKLVYEFLWDDAELDSVVAHSATYNLLKDQMDKIDRNPRLSQAEFERQLKALCVMIEERVGELTGRLDLNHGAYFRDPRILKVIAHFISHRCLPEWSRLIDADMGRLDAELSMGSFAQGDIVVIAEGKHD